MKLCRFELLEDPGVARSGIYHDSRMYETEGMQPVGVHDPTKIRFLSPIGKPPTVRIYHPDRKAEYLNPVGLMGPFTEIEMFHMPTDLIAELRIGLVVKDAGEMIESDEALSFLLGLTMMITLCSPSEGRDFPFLLGPCIFTLDEFPAENLLTRKWKGSITLNSEIASHGDDQLAPGLVEMISLSSQSLPLSAGDVIASAPIATSLGAVLSGARFSAEIDGVGVLTGGLG